MFKSYLKIAFRNLLKHKAFSGINIIGLAIGMAACLLIFQYVAFELSYDNFWPNSDRLYRVSLDRYQGGSLEFQSAKTFHPLGLAMKQDIAEVEAYTSFVDDIITLFTPRAQIQDIIMYWADSTFFQVFELDFIQGNPEKALQPLYSAVISKSIADKLFGNTDPIGKKFKVNEGWQFIVTGVFKDVPKNSHINLDVLVSYHTLRFYMDNWDNAAGKLVIKKPDQYKGVDISNRHAWRRNYFYTYIKTHPSVQPSNIKVQLEQLAEKYTQIIIQQGGKAEFNLQPIQDIHLKSHLDNEIKVNGDIKTVIALALIAIIILSIAWINFVNLSTVRSMERVKETGIRKVVGAQQHQLIRQYLLESVLVNFLAAVLAIIFVLLVNANVINLFEGSVYAKMPVDFSFWAIFTLIFLLGAFVSGLYPAFVLSSFKPVHLFKYNKIKSTSKLDLKKLLVILQFAASIVLLIGTYVVYSQINYMKKQDLGVNIDRLLITRSPMTMNQKPNIVEKLNTYKTRVLNLSGVSNIATSSSIPSREIPWHDENVTREGYDMHSTASYSLVYIDNDFIKTFDLQLLAGRDFDRSFGTNSESVILNETAVQKLEFANPTEALNKTITVWNNRYTIVGVVNDYHHRSLREPIKPTIFLFGYRWSKAVGYYTIRIQTQDVRQTVADIQNIWQDVYPGEIFNYFFLDDEFDQIYKADQEFGRIFGLFTILAIFIACLGLLGLVAYTTGLRTKEIGIRKVVGATETDIVSMLVIDFAKAIVIANIIAWPLAYYFINNWLENYAYRIQLSWWIFVLAGLFTLIIALMTVGWLAIRAATSNPAKALRYE